MGNGCDVQRRREFIVGESVFQNQLTLPAAQLQRNPFVGAHWLADAVFIAQDFAGLGHVFPRLALGLEQLPNAGEAQQFLGTQDGVGQPRFVVHIFLLVLHLGLRFERSQRLRAHQVVEIGANLRGGKQSLDGGDLDSGQAGIILL